MIQIYNIKKFKKLVRTVKSRNKCQINYKKN